MRSIHSAVLALAVLATGAVAAGAQSTQRDSARAAHRADTTWSGRRGDSARAARRGDSARPSRRGQAARAGRRAERGDMARARAPMARAAFRGIELTDAEKTNLKAIQSKYRQQLTVLRDSASPDRKALREARQSGDSAALKAFRANAEARREQGSAIMKQMNAELRAALTPEHQKQFDANVTRMQERAAGRKRGR